MTPPEILLWQLLRRSPGGIRFRRQYAIGPYVADFYCPAAKLVLEVDGRVHDSDQSASRDRARDELIESFGVRVQRILASDVMRDAETVAASIFDLCAERPLHQPAAGPPPHELCSQGGSVER